MHYAAVAWRLEAYGDPSRNGTIDASLDAYLTGVYWSVISLTTAGHVDVLRQRTAGEALWEVAAATAVRPAG